MAGLCKEQEEEVMELITTDLCVIKNSINMGRRDGSVSNKILKKVLLKKILEPACFYGVIKLSSGQINHLFSQGFCSLHTPGN